MKRDLPEPVKSAPAKLWRDLFVLPKFAMAVTRQTVSILWGLLGFLLAQTYGFARNAGALVGRLSVTDMLPRTFARYYTDGTQDVRERGPAAVGWGTPKKQITTGILLGGFFFATSLVSGGVTLALIVGVAVPVAVLGVIRLFPVVNSRWTKTRRTINRGGKKVYNVRKRGGKR